MRCLITGGAGFIGSHIVDEALGRGFEVRVLDDFSSGRRENLAHCIDDVELIVGDIRDRDTVERTVRDVDYVFHQAALVSVPETIEDPLLSAAVNDMGALNVMAASAEAEARRLVFAGSSAVYGGDHRPPHRETMMPAPDSPYAAHKLLGEHYAAIFRNLYGLDVVSLRYFNVYGPRQDPSSPYSGVLSIFIDRLNKNMDPVVYGDGGQSRDFVFVADVVRANFLAAESEGLPEKVFNIGTGKAVTINRVLDILADLFGHKINPQHLPPRQGDVYRSNADMTRAKEVLGFEGKIDLETGLALTLDWMRHNE